MFSMVQIPCAICLSTMNSEREANTIFTAPCSHSFHLRCIKECIFHHNHNCPLCRSPLSLGRPLFDDDDEPLPAPSSPPSPPAATIAAAFASPSSFTVLTNASSPSLSPHRRRDSPANLDLVAVLNVSGSRATLDLVAVLDDFVAGVLDVSSSR